MRLRIWRRGRPVAVVLVPSAIEALESAAKLTGYSRTDTINRALQLYEEIVGAESRGVRTLGFEVRDGQRVELRLTHQPARRR